MSNLIPFEGSALPAFFAASAKANSDLTQGINVSFPVLSIKGKVFTLVRDGNRTVITKPDEPDEAASSLEVVLVKANPNLSKVFYKNGYEDGVAAKPDCMSNDGKKPDPSIEKPVHTSCADCPKNAWGSGNGNGKACQDSRRVAVAPAGQLNDPMLLRVPPASLKPLAEFSDVCNKRGAPYNAVVVKLKFDREQATPKLEFRPIAYLDEQSYKVVMETAASDTVAQILGTGRTGNALPASNQSAAPEEAPAPTPAPAPKAAAKPAAPKAAAPKPAPAPTPAPAPAATDDDDLLGELNDLLGSTDD